MVLTSLGGAGLTASLNYVGVVTTPIVVPAQPLGPVVPFAGAQSSTAITKLESDVKALLTELQTLASKSGVTVADLQSLASDSQSITQAGFDFSASSLNKVISELATAVAGGASTAQAQTDFTALFSGSSVSSSVISSTFTDVVNAITDSNVTTTDLTTVASDEAAIQTDISKLPRPFQPIAGDVSGIEADLSVGVSQPIAIGGSPIVSAGPPFASALPPIVSVPPNVPLPPIIPVPPIIGPTPILPRPVLDAGLFGSLNYTGIVTSPVFTITPPSSTSTTTGALAQLKTDEQALQTELQSLAAKSGLTVADLESLTLDNQSVAQAGFDFNFQKLNPVISELATAVAGGTSTTQAQTDFTALFSGSSVSSSVITSTFNDLVKAVQDSKVTSTDLTTVAKDEAAIRTDLSNLHNGGSTGSTGTGTGSTGTGTTGTGSTGTGSTGSGTSGTGSGTTGKHGHHAKGHILVHAKAHHAAAKTAHAAVKSALKRK